MKKYFYPKVALMCLSLIISSGVLADTLYRCPNINEFSYDQDGTPSAKTNVNGVSVNWWGYHNGGSLYPKAVSLEISVLDQGGYGHPYSIRCSYKDEAGNTIHMFIKNDSYKATKTSGSEWSGDETLLMCRDADVNNCQFFITES